MKRRMSPIWAVVEMNSNAVGLTDVVRCSRTEYFQRRSKSLE